MSIYKFFFLKSSFYRVRNLRIIFEQRQCECLFKYFCKKNNFTKKSMISLTNFL